jgi:hypothetical protein
VAITPTTVICLRPLQSVRSPTAWSAAWLLADETGTDPRQKNKARVF